MAQLEQIRDRLAARLAAGEASLCALPPGSPGRLAGEHFWQLDELEYRAACELLRALRGQPWDRETVDLAVLARTWRDLEGRSP